MPQSDGQTRANLIILSTDETFMQEIIEVLSRTEYPFNFVTSPSDYVEAVVLHNPQIIIVGSDAHWAEPLLLDIQARAPNERPITVFIHHPDTYPEPYPLIDITLPYTSLRDLALHLSNALRMRQQLLAQHRVNTRLTAHLEQLQSEFQQQQQTSYELMEQIKNAVVYNVAHELRTPLLQVKSAVSILAEDIGRENRIVQLAMGAMSRLDSGLRNLSLLNTLIQEGLDRDAFGPAPVSEILDSVMHYINRTWEHKEQPQRLKIKVLGTPCLILCDSKRLVLAIGLIVDNALKFSKKRVEITVRPSDNGVRFIVKDRGIGIPADQLERIFDIFFQVDSSATRRYNGMGIGLAIARHIIERHNGTIYVESEQGTGTTFWFDIPCAD